MRWKARIRQRKDTPLHGNTRSRSILGTRAKEDPALVKQAPPDKINLHPLLAHSWAQHLRDDVPSLPPHSFSSMKSERATLIDFQNTFQMTKPQLWWKHRYTIHKPAIDGAPFTDLTNWLSLRSLSADRLPPLKRRKERMSKRNERERETFHCL